MATKHTPSRNEEEYVARVDADAEHSGFVTNLLNIFK